MVISLIESKHVSYNHIIKFIIKLACVILLHYKNGVPNALVDFDLTSDMIRMRLYDCTLMFY